MKITEEIFQVGGAGYSSTSDAAVYLIHVDGHAALVDSGCGDSVNTLMKNAGKRGVTPEMIAYLLITHCHFDHTGGAVELRKRTGAKLVCHQADAAFLEAGDPVVTAASWYGMPMPQVPVDIKLNGERSAIFLGERRVEALHMPGHSPGSVVYLMESQGKKVLFGQDVHGPLDPSLLSDRTQYLNSLRRILALDVDILCEGHFGVYEGKDEVKSFIQRFL